MAPIEDIKKERPNCPCCGARMDLIMASFGTKITIEGHDYFCNNPACYCQTSEQQKLDKGKE